MGDIRFLDKEIEYNGVPIETIPMSESAIHWDDRVVLSLAYALVCQAVQDWKSLNRGTKEAFIDSYGERVYRGEVQQFYKGSLFANIINVICPNVEYDYAFEHMDWYEVKLKQLGYGRGRSNKENDRRGGRRIKKNGD